MNSAWESTALPDLRFKPTSARDELRKVDTSRNTKLNALWHSAAHFLDRIIYQYIPKLASVKG